MSVESILWIKVAHVVGFVLWTGGMLTCIQLLMTHSRVEGTARSELEAREKQSAILMDIGALLAIAAGLWLAFGIDPSPFKGGGWLHAKLTLVAIGMIGLHVVVRRKIRKFRNGEIAPLSPALMPALLVIAAVVVLIAVRRPF